MAHSFPDTYNWDTAFAVRLDDVNRLLARDRSGTRRFEISDSAGGEPVVLAWSFGPWKVTDIEGSEIDVTSGFRELVLNGASLDVTGLTCTFTCEMVFKEVQRPDAPDTTSNTLQQQNRDWATVQLCQGGPLSPRQRAAIEACLDAWFRTDEGRKTFEAHFAGLVINSQMTDDLSFLQPKAVGLAGATLADDSLALGVLARTLNGDIAGCPYQLTPYAIPEPARTDVDRPHAGFVMSAELFLTQMVLPHLSEAFGKGSDPKAPTYSFYDHNKIRNDQVLQFTFETEDKKSFVGTIAPKKLRLALTGDTLTITIDPMLVPIDFLMIRGIETANVTITHRLKLALLSPDDDPDHRVLAFVEDGPPVVENTTSPGLLLTLAQPAVELISAIIGVIAGVFVGRAAARKGVSLVLQRLFAVVTATLVTLVGKAVASVPDIILHLEEGSLEKLPNFSEVLDGALRAVTWPIDVRYEAVSATFNENVHIGVRIVESNT